MTDPSLRSHIWTIPREPLRSLDSLCWKGHLTASVCFILPVSGFQIRVESEDSEARCGPYNWSRLTREVCPVNAKRSVPVLRSQTRTVWSDDEQEQAIFLVGSRTTLMTKCRCGIRTARELNGERKNQLKSSWPVKIHLHSPVIISQTRTQPSELPETSVRPRAAKVEISSLWPCK